MKFGILNGMNLTDLFKFHEQALCLAGWNQFLNVANNVGNVFKKWDEKVYAQVLENFWKRFGLTKFEILPYGAERPMSYLI